MHYRLGLSLCALMAVSACFGTSDLASQATAPVDPSQRPADPDPVPISDIDLSEDGTLDLAGNGVSMLDTSGGTTLGQFGGGELIITTENGEIVRVVADGPSIGGTIVSEGGDIGVFELDGVPIVTFGAGSGAPVQGNGGLRTSVINANGTERSPLNHLVYGVWLTDLGTGDVYDVVHAGNRTPASAVPSGGTAIYQGTAVGAATTGSGVVAFQSTVQAETGDFRTFNFETTGSTMGGDPEDALNASGTLTVSGGRLTGTIASSGATGEVEATFYGPDAVEMGGAYTLEGGGLTAIATFGASRDPQFQSIR